MGSRYAASLQVQACDLDGLLSDTRPIVVAFEAAESSPCTLLAPELDELAREFGPRALIVRVLEAGDASFAARHHLLWLPTVVFWHGGRERLRLAGAVSIEVLRAHLGYVLEGGPLPAPMSGPRRAVRGAFGHVTASSSR